MAEDDPYGRYEARREAAREATKKSMGALARSGQAPALIPTGLDLRRIDQDALRLADGWTLPWGRAMSQLRPYARRFEVAVWCGATLCGLGAGRASRGKRNVSVHFVERRADDNPLSGFIALIVLDCAYRYGQALGSERVLLRNPRRELIPHYERLGFSLAETRRGSTYYSQEIDP